MGPEWVAILALVALFVIGTLMPINMGALAYVAAWLVGMYSLDLDEKTILAGISADLVLTLIGVTYLFAIARQNGTVDLIVRKAVGAVGGRVALIPWVMFAVTAVLTGIGRQTLLSRLVADIRAAAAEAGITVVDDVADRRALTAALRHLVSLGVLHETEGTVDAQAEALITIDTDLLGQLLTGPVAEATSPDRLVELAARPGPRGVEHAVRRKLVENPVVLYADLPAEQLQAAEVALLVATDRAQTEAIRAEQDVPRATHPIWGGR